MSFSEYSLAANLTIFGLAAFVIAVASTYLTSVADRLADRTGLGEAVIGGVLLGASTSLSGMVTSVTAAAQAHADLATANAIGGIAAQTAFLAIADLTYRRANLEHAAASLTNLNQATLLVVLLAMPLTAAFLPPIEIGQVHVVSFAIAIVYLRGLRLIQSARHDPMWKPVGTSKTRRDLAEENDAEGMPVTPLLVRFVMLAFIVAFAGWLVANTAVEISAHTGLSQSAVGALLTAVATSLPELITTLAAVKRGALQLAVGGIIGGNTFDVLFLVVADSAYRPGSIYHAADREFLFWIGVSILMTGVLILGLLRRERHGPANIGFESVSILLIYAGALALSAFGYIAP
jgi:cation:H+ antiporter